MIAEDLFKMTMALIDEMLDDGTLDDTVVAEYRAKTPAILTLIQSEIVGIENRYRSKEDYIYPQVIEDMQQPVQVDDTNAISLMVYFLGAHLMIHENTTVASYFNQRFEELRALFLKPTPKKKESIRDVYDASCSY